MQMSRDGEENLGGYEEEMRFLMGLSWLVLLCLFVHPKNLVN